MKRIAILGSTGSIGRQTLAVIKELDQYFKVVALAAHSSDDLIADQARQFQPEVTVLYDQEAALKLQGQRGIDATTILSGPEGLLAAATWPSADLVVLAQVGFSGFEPLIAALKAGKNVALANKESLVIGGEILEKLQLLDPERIYPIDSEHSAIWQSLRGSAYEDIEKIYLTASGGPFFGYELEALERVTPEMALKHPNWQMGRKITIDSATMMNKGLEVIEAKWLFNLKPEQIEVIVHRQSIVHSMVEFIDGSLIAQLGLPDMRIAIQYALTYPQRKYSSRKRFCPFEQQLNFDCPDRHNFPCLDLAYQALAAGKTMPAVLNGANEIAVNEFLAGRIRFTEIAKVIAGVMDKHVVVPIDSVSAVIEADRWSRQAAAEIVSELTGRVN